MPFTFSHPAVIIPLLRRHSKWISATGLIIGSMAPDFESFFLVTDTKIFGHTWAGIFWFDMPLGIALMFLFHGVVRDPLIDHLPRPLEERFGRFRHFDWGSWFRRHYAAILFSLFIGICSHLLWDACTHLNFHYPDARSSQLKIAGRRVYKVLQYASSIIGLAAVVYTMYKIPRMKTVKGSDVKYIYWLVIALLAVLFAAILITVVFRYIEIWAILLLYIIMSSGMYALIIVSLFYKLLAKRPG